MLSGSEKGFASKKTVMAAVFVVLPQISLTVAALEKGGMIRLRSAVRKRKGEDFVLRPSTPDHVQFDCQGYLVPRA